MLLGQDEIMGMFLGQNEIRGVVLGQDGIRGVFLGQSAVAGFIFLSLLPGKHRGLISPPGALPSPPPACLTPFYF